MQTIKTERLILRPFTKDDLEAFYNYAKSPYVGPPAGWQPHKTLDDTAKILKDFIEKDEVWAIVEQASLKIIGSIALQTEKIRENPNSRHLGYVLDEHYWGKGYATEAGKAAIKYAFEVLNLEILTVKHFSFNTKSQNVIKKLGFVYEGTLRRGFKHFDGNTYDLCHYSILREEYFK